MNKLFKILRITRMKMHLAASNDGTYYFRRILWGQFMLQRVLLEVPTYSDQKQFAGVKLLNNFEIEFYC